MAREEKPVPFSVDPSAVQKKIGDSAQFCSSIMEAASMFPHLRIGQLIVNAITYDLYNVTDEQLIAALRDYMRQYNPRR